MDRETRNRIQRATQAARELLEHEYAEQLEGVFDIRLDGTIAAEPGEHLDAAQRVLRGKLVTAVEHQRTSGMSNADAVGSYLREAAFTTLNRFVALKMLEARELVQECVSRGDQSAGFKEFAGLARGLVQLPDHGYRIYIESLFDEIGREVRVLFDRRDPASLLWPRRQGLLDLLAILNASELGPVWGEDETIGWVYQYFNSDDDRQRARYDERGKPKAPESSHELAVRNQFFTPRYVVQFLTDNTLGRLWYEMRQGDTRLRDLEYLVCAPTEVFLADGQEPPSAGGGDEAELEHSGELQRRAYVPFRLKQDPRDIRVLDPACGSGHFLLYAFDLLLSIYQEAWDDPTSPPSEATGRTLRDDYAETTTLQAAAPGLILRHNLHGIDIDARCAQIAALALWMRAQRAHKSLDITRDARPPIQKTNIVVAEPMPGDLELRSDFVATLEPKIGQLLNRVFERMELAGEAGSLLRIEDDIRDAVRETLGEHGDLFRASDEERWKDAEKAVLEALREYSEQTRDRRTYERRLFAEDAARGLGLVDSCSQRFHVVLMNPPFGEPPARASKCIEGDDCGNMYGAFVRRAKELGASMIGCISDRTFVTQASYKRFRQQLLHQSPQLSALLDLGWGVLDANVQVAAFVLSDAGSQFCSCLDVRTFGDDRAARSTANGNSWRPVPLLVFQRLPDEVLAYSLPWFIVRAVERLPALGDIAELPRGLGSNKAARTYLAWFEVPDTASAPNGRWRPLANGGEYSPYWRQDLGVADWLTPAGTPWVEMTSSDGWRPYDQSGTDAYFRPGLAFPKQSSSFNVSMLPSGFLPTREGKAILPKDGADTLFLLAYLNSRLVRSFVRDTCGLHKQSGAISRVPIPTFPALERQRLEQAAKEIWASVFTSYCYDETSRWFVGPVALAESDSQRDSDLAKEQAAIDALVLAALGLASDDVWLDSPSAPTPYLPQPDDTLSWAIGVALGRFVGRQGPVAADLLAKALEPPEARSPAMLVHADRVGSAVLVDDPGHESDLLGRVREVYTVAIGSERAGETTWREDAKRLAGDDRTMRQWLAKNFFERHIERYSKSRRKAPIYWQLATPSASYSVWLYCQRFTRDTFYRILSDFVTPKLNHEERKLATLAQEAGANSTGSQRTDLDAQERYVSELRAFQDEISRVAPLWNPDLNDGVIVNFAPLWRLVPHHRAWQKECRSTWDKLCKGDYDWAHLAMHLWPERVVPRCAEDRSLAIAHGLDDVFWYEDSDGKWQPRKVTDSDVAKLVKERTSAAVRDALKSLLEAPAPVTGRATRKKAPRAKGTRKRAASARPKAATNGASSSGRPSAAVDAELLSKVKDAIGSNGDGASKADVVDATGISASEWNKAIKALLADGSVTQTGEHRGALYHLGGGDA